MSTQLGGSQGVEASELQRDGLTVHNRRRLYRIADGNVQSGTGVFTEVWDSLEQPYVGKIPDGEPYHTSVDSPEESAQVKMTRFCLEHDIHLIGSWDAHGGF
ncbi:MAG: hypothetical protein JWN89_189 [Parcubacteria group bacterium]|nr:hypothetical protein [Parcubacteria group bacterium]